MNAIKLFARSALGAALGVLAYQVITRPLLDGQIHVVATIIAMVIFGVIFGIISAYVHSGKIPSLLSSMICGLPSVAIVVSAIILVLGGVPLADLLSFEPTAGVLGLSALIGGGGYLVLLIGIKQ
jgi:hypothetical protein